MNKKMPRLRSKKKPPEDKLLYDAIRLTIDRLCALRQFTTNTQAKEVLNTFKRVIGKREESELPYNSHGIGCATTSAVHGVYSEMSCLIIAYWAYLRSPSAKTKETVTDHIDYLDQLCREPETVRMTKLSNCKYRVTNDRIQNGNKLVED